MLLAASIKGMSVKMTIILFINSSDNPNGYLISNIAYITFKFYSHNQKNLLGGRTKFPLQEAEGV